MSHIGYGMRLSGRGMFLVGVTGAIVGTTIGAAMSRVTVPLAVGAIKQGIIFREGVRARVEELREDLEDLTARAEQEYRAERKAQRREPREGA
ncbi:MAG: DUF5132 domain-containing protein [Chloroflexi bacterium]|nr:DUF5132 domain-containing protein [Chloroflexota bacterium]